MKGLADFLQGLADFFLIISASTITIVDKIIHDEPS